MRPMTLWGWLAVLQEGANYYLCTSIRPQSRVEATGTEMRCSCSVKSRHGIMGRCHRTCVLRRPSAGGEGEGGVS